MKGLRDSWRWFTVLMLLFCGITILWPQARLLSASLLSDSGKFTLVSRAGGLDAVPEMTRDYTLKTDKDGVTVTKRGDEPLRFIASGTNKIVIHSTSPLSVTSASRGEMHLGVGSDTLLLTQQAPRSLFSRTAAKSLTATLQPDGTVILGHATNAFITAENPTLTYTLGHYFAFFATSETLHATLNSLMISFFATTLAALIGVTLAYMIARFRIAGANALVFMVTMASVSPPFLGAYAWRLLLGRNGIVTALLDLQTSIVGIYGVIWVITWLVFPVIFLLSYSAFRQLDASHIEAAESLGASPLRARLTVEIPLAMPGIVTGLYLAMMAALSDFGTPRIIGLDLNVLPVLIYNAFLSEAGRNPALAATGSVVLVAISSLFLMMQQLYLSRRGYAAVSSRRPEQRELSRAGHCLTLILSGCVLLLAFVPHITVLVTSFVKWRVGLPTLTPTLANYVTMWQNGLMPAWVTLSLGLSGTLVAFAGGLGVAYVLVRKRYTFLAPSLSGLVMLPYVIPGTVLGIGLILIFNQAPLQLTGTWFILALAYVVRNLPFTVKASEAALRQVHPALDEAAISLGARPARVFLTITAPLMLAGALTGATLTFLHIVTELSSTIVLYRPPWKPMTAVIFENTLVDADFGISAAQTILLMLIIYVPLYAVVRYGQSERNNYV